MADARDGGPVRQSAKRDSGWPALRIDAPALGAPGLGGHRFSGAEADADLDGRVTALIADFNPIAIEDLAELPLPPGGLWDPTFPPILEPPPTPLRWRAFFNTTTDRDAAHVALAAAFPALTLADVDIPDEDWAARSQRSLTAVRAGRFIVAPPWDVPASSEECLIVMIEPSMGFGTGHHATTRLCLRALSAMELQGRSVLDLGTGSGVLAIAAAMAGARAVVGIDVDRDAIDNARHNASLNRVFVPPTFEVADFREHTLRSADLVVANLTGGMLRSSADAILALVAPGGTLLVSGFDESEHAAVHEALGDWKHESSATEERWVALTLTDGPA